MKLGLLLALLLHTVCALEDCSPHFTAARHRVSDLFISHLRRLPGSKTHDVVSVRDPSALAIPQLFEDTRCSDPLAVSHSESKWNSWELAVLMCAGLAAGFVMSVSPAKDCVLPAFDVERFTQTFKEAKVLREQGTCRLFMAKHGLDGQKYLVQERLLHSADALKASVKQSCEVADVLRYITCWIEQGPASSIRLFSQYAISH